MYAKITLLGVALALLLGTNIKAQDVHLDASMDGQTIYTNGGSFSDSGQSEDRYSNFEDYSTVVCSYSGAPLLIDFAEFYLEEDNDLLYVYYGEGLDMRSVPGSPFSGDELHKRMITSSGSCLTFRMVTDFNVTRTGWDANIRVMEPNVVDVR